MREVSERLRIPAQYLTMLEANDYGAIADELYLLPFVRSYAEFFGLEAETLATRFLSGIQPLEKVIELAPGSPNTCQLAAMLPAPKPPGPSPFDCVKSEGDK